MTLLKVLGLISDTHIPSRSGKLPQSVLAAFKDVDMILHAGDFEKLDVADTLEAIAPLKAVYGNMCSWEVKQKFLPKLTFKVEELEIGLTHGNGSPSGYISRVQDLFQNDNPHIIVSGHTHHPTAEIRNEILMLNPGSPTDKRFAPKNTVMILNIDKSNYEYKFVDV
ncbi:YfcE family phosphodiesterase [Candidatus Heimdallarchaeota archaeon B3_Heim]|nr:MAG: YfcE family phosphodiesterase [Candidatus Heimdallarchaeota archaeon B3_Heim]